MKFNQLKTYLIFFIIVLFACKDSPTENNGDDNGLLNGKVVFVSYEPVTYVNRITRLDIKKNKITHLTPPSQGSSSVGWPRWSSDGRKILFTESYGPDEAHIVMINEDGSNKKILTQIGLDALRPQWNHTGDKFLYQLYLYGTRLSDTLGTSQILPIDSSSYVFEGDSVWYDLGDLGWHPSDDFLYMRGSYSPRGTIYCPQDSLAEIFLYEIETGKVVQRITHNNFDECAFFTSPDGGVFVFHRGAAGKNQKFYYITVSDTVPTQLTSGSNDFSWEWSNDPNFGIFMKDDNIDWGGSEYGIYVINISDPKNEIKISDWLADYPDLFIIND